MKIWGAFFIFVVILLKPEIAVSGAQRAMGIWYSSVAPSLFPFLVLMPLITGKEACAAYEAMFSRWMRPLFRLPGAAAPAVIAGMIAGSPGGAIALRRVAANSNMTSSEARQVALAVAGVSPAYLIMGVGQGLYGSASMGVKLAVAQSCIQLLMLFLLSRSKQEKEQLFCAKPERESKGNIMTAVEGILGVCGHMAFFSMVAGVMAAFLGKELGNALLLIMDLPSGLATLAGGRDSVRMLLLGAAIGFTGLCIISQNMEELRELKISWKKYLGTRLISAALFSLACIGMKGNLREVSGKLLMEFRKTYAVSLFAAGMVVIPGLYLLSGKLFLNKRKQERN